MLYIDVQDISNDIKDSKSDTSNPNDMIEDLSRQDSIWTNEGQRPVWEETPGLLYFRFSGVQA